MAEDEKRLRQTCGKSFLSAILFHHFAVFVACFLKKVGLILHLYKFCLLFFCKFTNRRHPMEEAKKGEAEDVLKKLLASGMTAEEILAKLQ